MFDVDPLPTKEDLDELATCTFDRELITSDASRLEAGLSFDDLFMERFQLSSRSKLYSPRFKEAFADYPHIEALVELADHGAHLHLDRSKFTPNRGKDCKLRSSYTRMKRAIDHQLAQWQRKGWYLALPKRVLKNEPRLHINPLHWAPKKVIARKDKLGRVIIDSSASSDLSCSINEGTDYEAYARYLPDIKLEGLRDLCEIACAQRDSHPPGTRLRGATIDVSTAFQLTNYDVEVGLGNATETEDLYLVPIAAVFGWTMSPGHFNLVSQAIRWYHERHCPQPPAPRESSTYVDDGTLIATADRIHASASTYIKGIKTLCGEEAVRDDKCKVDLPAFEAIGWWLDLEAWTASPAPRAIGKILHALFVRIPVGTKVVQANVLHSVASLLCWYAQAIPSTQAFLHSLFQCLKHSSKPFHKVRLSRTAQADLHWWRLTILYGLRDRSSFSMDLDWGRKNPGTPKFNFFCDACTSVGGGFYLQEIQGSDTAFTWQEDTTRWFAENNADINVLEFLTCVMGVLTFAPFLANSLVAVNSDNTSAVAWLKKLRARSTMAATILRIYSIVSFSLRIHVVSMHIKGCLNTRSDALSRGILPSSPQTFSTKIGPGTGPQWQNWPGWEDWAKLFASAARLG